MKGPMGDDPRKKGGRPSTTARLRRLRRELEHLLSGRWAKEREQELVAAIAACEATLARRAKPSKKVDPTKIIGEMIKSAGSNQNARARIRQMLMACGATEEEALHTVPLELGGTPAEGNAA